MNHASHSTRAAQIAGMGVAVAFVSLVVSPDFRDAMKGVCQVIWTDRYPTVLCVAIVLLVVALTAATTINRRATTDGVPLVDSDKLDPLVGLMEGKTHTFRKTFDFQGQFGIEGLEFPRSVRRGLL